MDHGEGDFFLLNIPPAVVVRVVKAQDTIGIGAHHAQALRAEVPIERREFGRLLHARRAPREPDVEQNDSSSEAARAQVLAIKRGKLKLRRRLSLPTTELALHH